MIVPQPSDLDFVQADWRAQGAQYVAADDNLPLLMLLVFLTRALLILLCRLHGVSRHLVTGAWRSSETIVNVTP
jgi:hypothetical protein